MYERILQRFRESIRSLNYVVPLHADEEMDEDGLSVFDLENAVLTGDIVERQRDGSTTYVVGKLSFTGRLVIITVYRE